MLVLSFFSWWYGRGWAQVARSLNPRVQGIKASFSVNQLLRTLFAPWRKIISYPGRSLQDRMRAWLDNMFSRLVGFVVRLLVLLTAGLAMAATALVTGIELILWPFLPVLIPVMLIVGLLQ